MLKYKKQSTIFCRCYLCYLFTWLVVLILQPLTVCPLSKYQIIWPMNVRLLWYYQSNWPIKERVSDLRVVPIYGLWFYVDSEKLRNWGFKVGNAKNAYLIKWKVSNSLILQTTVWTFLVSSVMWYLSIQFPLIS